VTVSPLSPWEFLWFSTIDWRTPQRSFPGHSLLLPTPTRTGPPLPPLIFKRSTRHIFPLIHLSAIATSRLRSSFFFLNTKFAVFTLYFLSFFQLSKLFFFFGLPFACDGTTYSPPTADFIPRAQFPFPASIREEDL